MKKLIAPLAICLSLMTVATLGMNTDHASAHNDRFSLVKIDGKNAVYDSNKKVYITHAVKANGEEVSLTDYIALKGKSEQAKNKAQSQRDSFTAYDSTINTISAEFLEMSYYDESFAWTYYQDAQKATPTATCNSLSPEPCVIKVENAITDSESFSANLDAGDANYVRAGASFTWESSSQSTVGYESSIPQGKSGYINWEAYYSHTGGYIHYAYSDATGYHDLGTGDLVEGDSPRVLYNGNTDGLWTTVIF
ncbi:MAG TPA: hypothetical protein VFV52_18505 [Bacilli bacterium]|nr:hypothetical protein [Bacilli bacterium]